MESVRVQAKFVVASPEQVFAPGQLVVRDGKILEATAVFQDRPDLDLGDVVILPGLINAHSHLEFSNLTRPFPAGKNFPDWIRQVISHRRKDELGRSVEVLERERRDTIRMGLREAWSSGTVLLADIVSMPWKPGNLPTAESFAVAEQSAGPPVDPPTVSARSENVASPSLWKKHFAACPGVIALPEVLGLTEDRFQATWDWAANLLANHGRQGNPADRSVLFGLGWSPHAPYSLLFDRLTTMVDEISEPSWTAMHVAESLEELNWLEHGQGPFRESFDALGLPTPDRRPSIAQVIELLSRRRKALLVHGNYLNAAQIAQIARASSVSVVYCPRTHRHFGHPLYPLRELCRQQVKVVLATDSKASNPDLNLWSEVVAAREAHAELSARSAFSAVTRSAAQALDVESLLGDLTPGKRAYLNVVACDPHWNAENLLEAMTSTELCLRPIHQWLEKCFRTESSFGE